MFKVLASKDPNDTVAYQSDWTAFLADQGDLLDHAVVEIVDDNGTPVASDLVVEAFQGTAAGVVTYWLSGGVAGVHYLVRVTVFGARTIPVQADESETVVIPVRQK